MAPVDVILLAILTFCFSTSLSSSATSAPPICDLTTSVLPGGRPAAPEQFKFAILVIFSPTQNIKASELCTGTLMGASWVLVAAHCFNGSSTVHNDSVILVGGSPHISEYLSWRQDVSWGDRPSGNGPLQERRALNITLHPDYKAGSHTADLAIIQVEPFSLGPVVNIIRPSYSNMEEINCTILAWGTSEHETGWEAVEELLFVEPVPAAAVNQRLCRHQKDGPFICLLSQNNGLCTCDSGSPLVCDGLVWGVSSHRVAYGTRQDDVEVLYTEIWPYLNWIETEMERSTKGSGTGLTVGVVMLLLCVLWHGFL